MMKAYLILLVTVLVIVLIERTHVSAAPAPQRYVLRGNVTCNGTTKIQAKNATCTVELLDQSLQDAPAINITYCVRKAVRFPIAYSMSYTSNDLGGGFSFALKATCNDENGQLLYITKVNVPVDPTDRNQISSAEVPVESV